MMGEQRLPIYFGDAARSRRSHEEHIRIYEALLPATAISPRR